jgi:acyl-CoA dehydrogenase
MPLSSSLIETTVTRMLERADLAGGQTRLASGAFPSEIWGSVVDAGLPLLLCPAERGGIGGSLEEAVEVAQLCGRGGLPAPLIETIVGNWLCGLSGREPSEAPVISLIDVSTRIPDRQEIESGVAKWEAIPWARNAELATIAEGGANGLCVCFIPGQAHVVKSDAHLAGEWRDSVDLSGIDASSVVWHDLPADITGETILARMALLRAAAMVGAMERAAQMSIDYTTQRNQFGRPLAAFQGIQHMLAIVATEVAASRAAVMAAATEPDVERAVFLSAVAKARAGDAAGVVAAAAHQAHGAMGFTEEYGLGLATKRLWSWRSEDGSEEFWCEWLGARARQTGDLWRVITA